MVQQGIIEKEDKNVVAFEISGLVNKCQHQDNISKIPGTYGYVFNP